MSKQLEKMKHELWDTNSLKDEIIGDLQHFKESIS